MKGIKSVTLPNGSEILDGFSKLIVFEKPFVDKINAIVDEESKGYYKYNFYKALDKLYRNGFIKATNFTTKAGREAIRIECGNTHTIDYLTSSGDRSWNNWHKREPINGFYANAVATSNGGGCWAEIIIAEDGSEIITSEQQSYVDDLS